MDGSKEMFDLDHVNDLCAYVTGQIRGAIGGVPDIIIGLSKGGLYPAARVAELLDVELVIGLPILKIDGIRTLDPSARLTPGYPAHKRVVGIDDAIVSGKLLGEDLYRAVTQLGGHYTPVALVGVGDYPRLPGLILGTERPTVPTFFWKRGFVSG